MAALAREPVVQSSAVEIAESAVPAIELVIERGGEHFALLATHAPAPTSRDRARQHADLIAPIGQWVASREDHAVVVGKLNATLWSHSLQTLLDACHMVSSRVGFGLQATWPAVRTSLREDSAGISDPGMPSPGIPIDQVLHGNSLTTLAHEVGPSLGMAHRSVRVMLAPRALP